MGSPATVVPPFDGAGTFFQTRAEGFPTASAEQRTAADTFGPGLRVAPHLAG